MDDAGAEEVRVEAEPDAESASERRLTRAELLTLPGRGADEILRSMPGLHASSHGGTGKAYQLYIRGFDAVHGADVAVSVDGVPLNEPSNVHGQGYLDLHVVPRALVDRAELRPGAARPEDGDFAVAGAADLHLAIPEPGLWLASGLGTDQTSSAEVVYRPATRGPMTFVVASADGGHGVGEGRGFTQLRGAAGIDGSAGDVDLRAFVLAYRGRFDSPGVLRLDDLEAGRVGFYDAYDGAGDGASDRVVASTQAKVQFADWTAQAIGWGQLRRLRLDQNFTGQYDHPVRGDATRQTHHDRSAGLRARVDRAPAPLGVSAGVDLAAHAMNQQEGGLDRSGEVVVDPQIDAGLGQRGLAAWLSAPWRPWSPLTVEPGFRAAVWDLGLDRRLDTGVTDGDAVRATSRAVAPRLSARLRAADPLELHGAYGRGLRPPEIRGIEGGPAPVPTADTAEAGAAWTQRRIAVHAAAFATRVGNEIVFDPLAARFVATGATRRAGGYGRVVLRPVGALRLEGEVTGTDAAYVDSGDPVPFAPPWVVVGHAALDGAVLGPFLVVGGVRVWHLAARPLPQGFASTPATVADLTARLTWRRLSLDVDVDNLLGSRWRDGEFVFPSWWDSSTAPSALPERHISAGAPRALRVGFGWRTG